MLVPVTAVLTLLIAGALGLSITRSISHPLAQLVEGSRRLARGEFQHQVPVSGEDELAHLGQVFNQTARRLRDLYATLRSSEDQLRRVINTIPALVISALPDGTLDFVNERMAEYTGSSIGDLSGWNWAEIVHPDDLRPQAAAWRKALEGGQPMDTEVRIRRADGEYRWFLARNVPLRDDLGNIVRWYGTTIDIEDRKRSEKALRLAQDDLARINRVSTWGELTASLAHEISQPITGVITNTNVCLRRLGHDKPDLDEVRTAATRILRDAQRAAEIIGRIRSQFEKGSVNPGTLGVSELIRETVTLLRDEAMRYNISMRTELAADLPQIVGGGRGDRDRATVPALDEPLLLEPAKRLANRGRRYPEREAERPLGDALTSLERAVHDHPAHGRVGLFAQARSRREGRDGSLFCCHPSTFRYLTCYSI